MKTNLISLCICLTLACSAFAQTFKWPEEGAWPESPRIAAIKQVQMPGPSILTGACEFSVPLYTLAIGDTKIPFQLQYRSNGIRVDDDPAPIGYGWNLTPPLRVTRQIMGRPDEWFQYLDPDYLGGYVDDYATLFRCVTSDFATSKVELGYYPRYDTQHDIYTIHLLDKTLTLVRDKGIFKGIGCTEYIIEGDEQLSYINVTDPHGNIYTFGIRGEYVDTDLMTTEWLLSSLSLSTGEIISFEWTLDPHANYPRTYFDNGSVVYGNAPIINSLTSINLDNGPRIAEHTFGGAKNLAKVAFPGGTIEFDYHNPNGIYATMLKSMSVRWGKDIVHSATLQHTVNTLTDVDITGTGHYSFEYKNNDFGLQPSSDWWGFSNGKSTDHISPDFIFRSAIGPLQIDGADRSVDTLHIDDCILLKAVYPTGASVEWQYEPHHFNPQICNDNAINKRIDVPVLSFGGGIRVNRIKVKASPDDPTPRIRRYRYGVDGNGKAVIKATPLLNTFISEFDLLQARKTFNLAPIIKIDKILYANRTSDYMTGQTGILPIWYSEVTEYEDEGYTKYRFSDFGRENRVFRDWGFVVPEENHTIFAGGPKLIKKESYKKENNTFKPIEKTEYFYSNIQNPDFERFDDIYIRRLLLQFGDLSYAPDFGEFPDGRNIVYFNTATAIVGDIGFDGGIDAMVPIERNDYQWYSVSRIKNKVFSDRLDKKITTTYTDNGSIINSESYSYIPDTELISSKTIVTGNDSLVISYDYKDRYDKAVADVMKKNNIIGVPTMYRSTFNGSTTEISLEMEQCGKTVRPKRIWQKRGNGIPWSDTYYQYGLHGEVIAMHGADGVSTTWLWDMWGRYPQAITVGGILRTHATWKPLIGVETITNPAGVKNTYTYDRDGRLASVSIQGDLIRRYEYNINQQGNNYTKTYKYYSSSGKTSITERYDGLGRKWASFAEVLGSTIAMLTEYDALWRIWKEWAETPVNNPDASVREIISAARSFYGQQNPYAEHTYEPGERSLLCTDIKAGDAWHSASKIKNYKLLTNTQADGLYTFILNDDGFSFSKAEDGIFTCEYTVDEDGRQSSEFKDSRGLTIRIANASGNTDFVYDNYGDLRYILPPGILTGNSGTLKRNDDIMQKIAYWYDYNFQGQCTSVKEPGREAAYMAYDPAGRLVAEHSADHIDGEWRLYGYDGCRRLIVALDTKADENDISAFASQCRTAILDSSALTSGGYRFEPAWTWDEAPTLIFANYYDTYNFKSICDTDSCLDYKRAPLGGGFARNFTPKSNPYGLQTGLNTGNGFEVYYYDSFGREAVRCAKGYNIGRRYTDYTYDGLPSNILYIYPEKECDYMSHSVKYEYDRAGRMTGIRLRPLISVTMNDSISSFPLKATGMNIFNKAEIDYKYNAVGKLSDIHFGNNASQSFTYDVHGWKKSISSYYDGTDHSETLYYADGSTPYYNGSISAKQWHSGRYDYTYNNAGFLTEARYTASTQSGADFSTSYIYDNRGNMESLYRKGIIDRTPDGVELFGTLDRVDFYYSGGNRRLSSNDPKGMSGNIFEGRTGLCHNAETYEYAYDGKGRLVSDPSRGITEIKYNNDGRPTYIAFDDGHEINEQYDGLGRHIRSYYYLTQKSVFVPGGFQTLSSAARPLRVSLGTRTYCGDGHMEYKPRSRNDRESREIFLAFEGGFLDKNGNVFYNLTDYQGNITAIVDTAGHAVQTIDYYPYGETWRRPDAQINRRQYSAKEFIGEFGLNMLDFNARRYLASGCFDRPDALASQRPWHSPYLYCGADPINNTDPTGNRFTKKAEEAGERLISESTKMLFKKKKSDDEKSEVINMLVEITLMRISDQVFSLDGAAANDGNGMTTYDINENAVVFVIPFGSKGNLSLIAHEFKHGYQFLSGELDLGIRSNGDKSPSFGNFLYDAYDELDAYRRGQVFGGPHYNRYKITKEYPDLNWEIKTIYNQSSAFIPYNYNTIRQQKLNQDRNRIVISYKIAVRANGKTYKP